MTGEEFSEWFDYHLSCFPGIATWLENKVPTRLHAGVMEAWQRTLANIELEDARQATESIYLGQDTRPRAYEDHPAAVRRVALSLHSDRKQPARRTRIDGEETVACLDCRDDGVRWVWSDLSVRFADPQLATVNGPIAQRMPDTEQQAELGDDGTLYDMVVACPCAAGDKWRKRLALFDPQRHLPLIRWENGKRVLGFTSDKAEQQRLKDWVATRTATKIPAEKNMQGALPF